MAVETRSSYGTVEGARDFRLSTVKEHAKANCHQQAIGRLTAERLGHSIPVYRPESSSLSTHVPQYVRFLHGPIL